MPEPLRLVKTCQSEIEEILNSFAQHLLEQDRKGSVVSYTGDVKRFIRWNMKKYASFTPQEISPLDVVNYRTYLQEHGGRNGSEAAPATVNRALVSLRVFFAWLLDKGEVPYNPVIDVRLIKTVTKLAPKWLTRNEQAAFVRVVKARGTRDEAMFGLMLHAGLRIGELCFLKRQNIEIAPRSGFVHVRGKGNKERDVPLNITIRKILKSWFEENPEDPLWPNRYGASISVRGIRKIFDECAYDARLEDVTPHTLRHTFCKNLIDSGVPLDQVAALAGHESLNVTKLYTAPSESDLQAAVEKVAWE